MNTCVCRINAKFPMHTDLVDHKPNWENHPIFVCVCVCGGGGGGGGGGGENYC